jgi:uncharacterized sulfatase
MSGKSQKKVWEGEVENVRDHAIVEFHHQPTTVHLRTWVSERYKLTVYQKGNEGELFDLKNDPTEIHNLWSDPQFTELKAELLLKMISADLERIPMPMPRIFGA